MKYDPAEWARIAKDAGHEVRRDHVEASRRVRLFDTQGDATGTSSIARRTARICSSRWPTRAASEGIKFCVYHSIMDWHHPAQDKTRRQDYNPTSIKDGRKQEYVDYMKAQLDGAARLVRSRRAVVRRRMARLVDRGGRPRIYAFLRKLKPTLIINNRVGKGRKGMEGLNKDDARVRRRLRHARAGDSARPGLPGVDWESCMTMNDTWGFKKDDHNWKTRRDADSQPGRHRVEGRQLPAQRRPDGRGRDSAGERRAAGGDGRSG